ncbi:unnamed protein product [Linum tenue]|uniref:NB-ARC domain-containing protein n=1 Tax=Linum tenue TaxID=586396 RepID=A0AAV0MAE2_9ROSI|nr:unnamed protein product [Linum tenue]
MLEAVISNTLRKLGLIWWNLEQTVGSRILHGILGDLKRTLETLQVLAPNGEKARVTDRFPTLWVEDVKSLCYLVDDLLDQWEIDDINGRHRQSYLLSRLCFGCHGSRYVIYGKLKELNDNLILLTQDAKSAGITAEVVNEPFDSCRLTSSLFDPDKVVGREMEKRALVNMLVKHTHHDNPSEAVHQPCPGIISIVGYVGIGKTMLAKLVYSDPVIAHHFELRIWVCVSEKFEEMSIAKSIIQQVLPVDSRGGGLGSSGILPELARRIAGKRFLLVLDDVWEEDPNKWNSIIAALKHGSQQSRVLVTTRNQIAARSLNSNQIFRLPELPPHDCFMLFSRFAFARWGSFEGCAYQERDVRAVEKTCRGVPLIAETLGGIVSCRRSGDSYIGFSSFDLWGLEDILNFLWPTYYHIPPALKLCFAYCAVLPSGFQIPDDKLMKLWMAQGYLDLESSDEDAEVVGERYIQNLLMRSLLRVVAKEGDQGGHVSKGCRELEMPEAIHDFAKVCAASECCSVHDPDHYDISPLVSHLVIDPSQALHLSIVDWAPCPQASDSIQRCKRLRSLLVQSKRSSGGGVLVRRLHSLFTQLTLLRSLDLTDCTFKKLPSSIGNLLLLRLLILSSNKDLEELPEEICELSNLLTFEANCCESLKMLPKGIGKWVSLRHLGYFLESRKAYLPRGIRKLSCLRTLTTFSVGHHDESASLADLGNLNKLRGNFCINGLGDVADVSEAREAQLQEKKAIVALELNFEREVIEENQVNNDELLIEALQPQLDLVELTVKGYKGRQIFPSWLVMLHSLRKISLLLCDNCESLPPLGKLPCLEELDICYMPRVATVGPEFLGMEVDGLAAESSSAVAFPMLKQLTIINMLNWTEWRDWSETAVVFTKLRTLSLGDCPNLKALPEKLLRKASLEEVELHMCPLLEKRYGFSKLHNGNRWSYRQNISDLGKPAQIAVLEVQIGSERETNDHADNGN